MRNGYTRRTIQVHVPIAGRATLFLSRITRTVLGLTTPHTDIGTTNMPLFSSLLREVRLIWSVLETSHLAGGCVA